MISWWFEGRYFAALAFGFISILLAWLLQEPSYLYIAVATATLGFGWPVGLGATFVASMSTSAAWLAFPDSEMVESNMIAFSAGCIAAWLAAVIFGNNLSGGPAEANPDILYDSNVYLLEAVDATPAQIWTADRHGTPTHVNAALSRWSGISIRDLVAEDASALDTAIRKAIHPDDQARVSSALNRSFRSGNPFSMKYRQRRSDGEYRWIDGRAGPLRASDGSIIQWYGVCLDIDDHVVANENLQHRERELRDMVDAVPALVWLLTPQGETLNFNRTMAEWAGLNQDELNDLEQEGRHLAIVSLIHPDDLQSTEGTFSEKLESGEPLQMRMRLRRKDGEYRWVESRVAPLRDGSADILRWYGVSFEIEDQVRAVEALRTSEQYLRKVIDTVPVLVFHATADGTPIYANKRLAEFHGFKQEDFDRPGATRMKGAVDILVHPNDRDEVERDLLHSFRSGDPFRRRYRQRRADGVYRWVEGRMEALRDDAGKILEWYGVNLDVDDEVHAQEEFRRAQEELAKASNAASLAQLSASIAHEINQPLAAIAANARAYQQWLMHDPPNFTKAHETAVEMIRDAEVAAEIIKRVNDTFNSTPPATASASVNGVILEVCGLMAGEIGDGQVKLERHLSPKLRPVLIDSVQIQQVLVNLIRNALEAMAEVPTGDRTMIIRSTGLDNAEIKIEVSDSGPGITDVQRIFEPFFSTKAEGLGMGLSICRSIVESHGGKLLATSDFGQTTFSIVLPSI